MSPEHTKAALISAASCLNVRMDISPEPQSSVPNTSTIPPQPPVSPTISAATVTPGRQQPSAFIKFVRIFLLILIIIGVGLLCTQKYWVSPFVNLILNSEQKPASILKVSTSGSTQGSSTQQASTTAFSIRNGNVFWYGNLLKGIEPNSFKTFSYPGGVSDLYFEDRNTMYVMNPDTNPNIGSLFSPIADANPNTFAVLGEIGGVETEETYARDSVHVYAMGNIVQGADPDSFKLVGGSGFDAQDKNHEYYFGQIVR
jgi:hypothetical protein